MVIYSQALGIGGGVGGEEFFYISHLPIRKYTCSFSSLSYGKSLKQTQKYLEILKNKLNTSISDRKK